jgi:hypothetical protein
MYCNKLVCLHSYHFHPSLVIVGKAGANQSGAPTGTQLYCYGSQSCPPNIILGWNRLKVTNTLTYYAIATNAAVKSFIVPFKVFSKGQGQLRKTL